MKKVLIFGGSSAIAHQTALNFAAEGAELYLVDLFPERLNDVKNDILARFNETKIITGHFDALEFDKHLEIINTASEKLGGLDYILVAHGVLPDQNQAEQDIVLALKSYEINCNSVISICLHAANYFENRKSGCLAVISSVAGDRGRQSNYIYGSAKGALTVFLQGLRNRLAPKGINVVTIKPGQVDTPMTAHMPKGPLFAKSADVGRGIYQAMTSGKDEAYIPGFWKIIMCIVKAIPESIFKKMKM